MKNEIWSWIGDLSQVAGIKHYELRSAFSALDISLSVRPD